jgi:Uma2 family endonuclease
MYLKTGETEMPALAKRKLTVMEYLVAERAAERKHEYYQGEIFAMAGASREHNSIKDNLIVHLGVQLLPTSCRTRSSDQRVAVANATFFTYPDIVVLCGEGEYADEDRDTLLNPKVIFEVLSPTTQKYDRNEKFKLYQAIESLEEYVLVHPREAKLERFHRHEDGSWQSETFAGLTTIFEMQSVSVRIPLQAIYDRVPLLRS